MTTNALSYRTGTVTIANASANVTGTGTLFLANVKPGDRLRVGTLVPIEILSVNLNDGASALTLSEVWPHATQTAQPYEIIKGAGWGDVSAYAANVQAYLESIKRYTSGSTVSIGTGSKSFDIGAQLPFLVGARIRVSASADPTQWMEGVVTSYAARTLTINVASSADLNGSGSYSVWNLNESGERGQPGPASASTPAFCQPQGRLTLSSGLPRMQSQVSGASNVYYTPDVGDLIPIWSGSVWNLWSFTQLTLALDTTDHPINKNFDVVVFDDSGTRRLGTMPAWTDDTTRAAAVTRRNGLWVNDATVNVRHSSGTASVAANRATLVGTIRTSAAGQTSQQIGAVSASGGGNNKLYVWNFYNQIPIKAYSIDTTSSWTYNVANTFRSANASDANRISFVTGQNEQQLSAWFNSHAAAAASTSAQVGVKLDATNGQDQKLGDTSSIARVPVSGEQHRTMGLGHHFIQAVENVTAANTCTFYGGARHALMLMLEG